MDIIKQKAIADDTFMKAPNGKPTNLTERQWLQIRTKAFKEWFGDWEGNPFASNVTLDAGSFSPENVDALGYRPAFAFRQNGIYVGEIQFENLIANAEGEYIDGEYLTFPEVGWGISIEPEFRGKGLGKAMYYEAAKYAARQGKTLRSATINDTVSDSAKRVWDSFVKNGYASI